MKYVKSNHYKDIGKEFRELARDNKSCKKSVMKFSILLDPKENLSDKKNISKSKHKSHYRKVKIFKSLKPNCRKKNISVETRFIKENKLTGISFQYDYLSMKGSAMGEEFKASSIEKELQKEKSITMWGKGKLDKELYNSLNKEEKIKFMQEKNQKLFGTLILMAQ